MSSLPRGADSQLHGPPRHRAANPGPGGSVWPYWAGSAVRPPAGCPKRPDRSRPGAHCCPGPDRHTRWFFRRKSLSGTPEHRRSYHGGQNQHRGTPRPAPAPAVRRKPVRPGFPHSAGRHWSRPWYSSGWAPRRQRPPEGRSASGTRPVHR